MSTRPDLLVTKAGRTPPPLSPAEGVAPGYIVFDRVGLSFVGPWMVLFSVLVPAPPREALVALLASATAVPVPERSTGTRVLP